MKRIEFTQLMTVSNNLKHVFINVHVTNPRYALQTAHTEVFHVSKLLSKNGNQTDRLIRIMSRYSTMFRKAWLYVSDEDFIKYF